MTTLHQHIQDLPPGDWAALARRAAHTATTATRALGLTSPAELITVAAMTDQELLAHRIRNGPGQQRLSPAMRLVEADHLRSAAEHLAATAQQDQADAHAEADLARAETARAVHEAAVVRERLREIEIESDNKDDKRAADHAADQRIIDELRDELARTRADAESELAAAHHAASAAHERANQRAVERTRERTEAETTIQGLRDRIELLTADTATRLATAAEQVRAADARTEQRTAERTADRQTAEHSAQEARSELERVRADSAAAVAEARGQASGKIADAHAGAAAEIARARDEADAAVSAARAETVQVRRESEEAIARARERANSDVARIRAAADQEIRRARQAAQQAIDSASTDPRREEVTDAVAPIQLADTIGDSAPVLPIPQPSEEIRADTDAIQDALAVIRQVDQLCWQLEQNTGPAGVRHSVPIDNVRSLIRLVQQQADDLAHRLHTLTTRQRDPHRSELAAQYARDAGDAYSGFLQRIMEATDRLAPLGGPDADAVTAISEMLDGHPWVS